MSPERETESDFPVYASWPVGEKPPSGDSRTRMALRYAAQFVDRPEGITVSELAERFGLAVATLENWFSIFAEAGLVEIVGDTVYPIVDALTTTTAPWPAHRGELGHRSAGSPDIGRTFNNRYPHSDDDPS